MNRKIYKVFSPINIILMISLIANIIVIPRMRLYEGHISEEISSSVNNMLTSLSESQEVVEQILNSKRIDERQYKSMYFDYEDFEDEFMNLVDYASKFQSESESFSNIGLVIDICEQLYQFGEENKLSLYRNRGDEIKAINLTDSEIEMFESINQESILVLDAFFEDDDRKEYSVKSKDWVRIIEGIYEYTVEEEQELQVLSEPSSQPIFEPTLASITDIMDYSKGEVIKYLGEEYKIVPAGAEGSEDGYYYEKYGVTLVFENSKPYRIMTVECNETVSIEGARHGMTVEQITEILGEGEAFEAEYGEYVGRYYLNYHSCNRIIQFGSPEKDANTDYLEIRRDYKSE